MGSPVKGSPTSVNSNWFAESSDSGEHPTDQQVKTNRIPFRPKDRIDNFSVLLIA
jgi:hypothetical protein